MSKNITLFAFLALICPILIQANGMDYDLSGINSVADVQSIPVPENPDAAYFLKIHNGYRSLVARGKVPGLPIPHYMPDMEWDYELEDAAKKHAAGCYNQHSFRKWGEIRGWANGKNNEPLHEKFNQIEKFLQDPKPFWHQYSAFAQMIAANSRRLGCARHYCPEDEDYLTVCNYWSKYHNEYVMPYTSNASTPFTRPYCLNCYHTFFADLENDTRMSEKETIWGAQRPGSPMPPKVLDSSYFLDLHNAYRDWLAKGKAPFDPKPVYMAKMEWDPVLENNARRIAESCDNNDMFWLKDTTVITAGLTSPNRQLIHRFFDRYLREPNWILGDTVFENRETTFVWGTSRNLGCWQTRCTPYYGKRYGHREDPSFNADLTILVCSYHPQAEIIGFHPYIYEFNDTRPPVLEKPPLPPKEPENPKPEYYVAQHNMYREKVRSGKVANQPAAKDLPDLKWSDSLAAGAADVSLTCTFNRHHASSINANIGFDSTDVTSIIYRWFRGHETYTYGNTVYNPTDASSAYTRLIWANSTEVGCHKRYCWGLRKGDQSLMERFLTVCVYSPGGNVEGQLPYVKA